MNPHHPGEVLRERADLPDTPHAARMAGVRARVRAARRRRALAAFACVAPALAGISRRARRASGR
ncbi:hypothetical protein [Saccharothrix syringae]|uniref:Uncharacterized protein n=1 Tax=Saccharothrix syringae TaxID=103733 RepID=A0A5Q0GWR5_SACSY|nr:hypothetical protein [Saccharothrix syringae]QFZ18333.1 hypothetical protein EKG83_13320 [Saccharothrix syringae]